MAEVNPAFERLEDQLSWYDTKSMENQKWYKRLKVAEIISAAIIPFTAGFDGLGILTGILGVLIVIFIGIQSLNQYHDNWISYRSTAEQLKHEKYLWLSKAGPYRDSKNPEMMLAERVESLISREHAKWEATMEKIEKDQTSDLKYFLRKQRRWEILDDFIDRHNRSKAAQVSSFVERVKSGHDGIDPDTFSCWKRLLKKYSQVV